MNGSTVTERSALESFVRRYTDRTYMHTTLVRHRGRIVAIAIDDTYRFWYAVLDTEPEESNEPETSPPDGGPSPSAFDTEGWPDRPVELIFPREIAEAGYDVADPLGIPVHKQGHFTPERLGTTLPSPDSDEASSYDYFLSTTARLSAPTRFQAMSDGAHIYLFRQALGETPPEEGQIGDPIDTMRHMVYVDRQRNAVVHDDDLRGPGYVDPEGNWIETPRATPIVGGTLLVDRFALAGDRLVPKREVRYQRSRHRTRPASRTDSLGAADLDGNPFYEPTLELSFLGELHVGQFSVLLLPTEVAEVSRWQFFMYNSRTKGMDAFNVERSSDGLFNTMGSVAYTCEVHRDVFSPGTGVCSRVQGTETCGRDLIPRVSLRGHAETALRFDPSARVAIEPRVPIGGRFTIEAWLKPEQTGQREAWQLLVDSGGRKAEAGLSVWISTKGKVRAGFGDGTEWYQHETGPIVSGDRWQHVAIVSNGTTWKFYVDGVERDKTKTARAGASDGRTRVEIKGKHPVDGTGISGLGSARSGFVGIVDELRVWNRPRPPQALRDERHRRLTGLEPGLASYWRFDEASGGTVYDQTEHGHDGSVRNGEWISSDAPIGEHSGLSRSSFRFAGRRIATGPAAVIYHRQGRMPCGYEQQPGAVKQEGRVLFAVPTQPVGGDPADIEEYVAALDIGVSASGRLAQLPDVIALDDVEPEKPANGEAQRQVTMPLLRIDGTGLSLTGGLLRFAWTPNAPHLFDSATGNVVLYYRGTDDQFFAAYYTSSADTAVRTLADEAGMPLLRFAAQATDAELADLEVTVSGTAKQTCTVKVKGAGITEEWKRLPRNPEKLVAIINGQTPDATAGDATDAYDYSANTLTTPPAFDLRNGSLLVRGLAVGSGRIPVGTQVAASLSDDLRACHWTAAAPGLALRFDAEPALGTPEAAAAAARTDDLTMEAWVRPPLDAGGVSIIEQSSDGSGYGLHLVKQPADGCLFGGGTWVRIPDSPALDIEGDITIEAWVQPSNFKGLHYIVGRSDSDAEIFLRIGNGMCEAGSYDATMDWRTDPHKVQYTVTSPETDGEWLHFAAVWHNGEWCLYRNAEEVGRVTTRVGGVRLDAPWLIGASRIWVDRTFEGAIDDVRIWRRARSQGEIEHDKGRRLSGDEEGLAGYWRLSDGDLADRTLHGNDGVIEGVTSSLLFNGKSSCIGIANREELNFTGEITLEAWIRPKAVSGTFHNILAHGHWTKPNGEVYLRINQNGTYQAGSWQGGNRSYFAIGGSAVDDVAADRWVHLAATYDGQAWELFRNGESLSRRAAPQGAIPVNADWAIGARGTRTERFFDGEIGEVRIWNRARSVEEIRRSAPRRLFGDEDGLVGYWPLGEHGGEDLSPTGADGELRDVYPGGFSPPPSPIPAYALSAQVAGTARRSHDVVSPYDWAHVAAVYEQSSALALDGDSYLDCGNDPTLDVRDDLTIEVDLYLDDLADDHGILSKGQPSTEEDQQVPYAVTIDQAGRIRFTFEDDAGTVHQFWSARDEVKAKTPQRLAITRVRQTEVDEGGVSIWHDISFYVNNKQVAKRRWSADNSNIGGNTQSLRIGRAHIGDRLVSLRGQVSQVRLWNSALTDSDLGRRLTGREKGLLSWWPIEERTGSTTSDRKSANHARIRGAVNWVNDPNPDNSTLELFLDGRRTSSKKDPRPPAIEDGDRLAIGSTGTLDEIRIWNRCRTTEQIHDNLFGRLRGGDQGHLIAYYTFDDDDDRILDHSPSGLHLDTGGGHYETSTAPVGDDIPLTRSAILGVRNHFNGRVWQAPGVWEYGDLQLDDTGELTGVLKRCYSYQRNGEWNLVTGFKVGDLQTTWIGQVQFAPQLKGYIEGAPPVPGENLKPDQDYDDGSTVELLQAERVERTYASERSHGFDQHTEFVIGPMYKGKVNVSLFGLIEKRAVDVEAKVGLKGVFDTTLSHLRNASSSSSRETQRETRLGLRGRFDQDGGGNSRYVADNTGLALVESETADVFALRLYGSNALVGLEMRPNPDIPRDWNLIHFPIDPRYTKQGTLDGRIGTMADDDYPDAMAPGSDASYYKPIEAYALKNRVREDEERERVAYERFRTAPSAFEPSLPDLYKRNIINTYVWTADGGFFAETEEKTDSRHELIGGSYEFKGMGGVNVDIEFAFPGGWGGQFKLDALFGGHLNQLKTKSEDEENLFSVAVDLGNVEHDIYAPAVPGVPATKQEGKVDAYRFMTFYLDPNTRSYEEFFGRVVDPIWLAESDSPAAVAIRQARQDGKNPACWRVLHRVTYVSRVLPKFTGAKPRTFEQRMSKLDIASNHELITQLEPYVVGFLDDPVAFREAVERTLADRLPELVGDAKVIADYMLQYFGVVEGGG